ncbi:MAG: acetyl-CoA carboxylase, biotin carboxyl carrier protein [Bacillota bacterium]|jgi:acetyl-CoA carboxylase biotin carboxyl carrier protein
MDFKKVQDLIKYFESSKLTTMTIEDGNFKLSLSKLKETINSQPKTVVVNEPKILPPNVNLKDQTNVANKPTEDILLKDVTSPLVGTYYAASSPTSEPFVKIGQRVNKGQTVCIVEAMKIMNEIASPFSGVVEKINCKNGDVVGFNQVVISIRPQE